MKRTKPNPNEVQGDAVDRESPNTQEETACPGCGMKKAEWTENKGRGYEADDEVYCCRACAEGTGCTCSE